MASLIPTPAVAVWPDGGTCLFDWLEEPYAASAHKGDVVRVWCLSKGWETNEKPYYPIHTKDMTDDELERSIKVAIQMLSLPQNRKTRRTLDAAARASMN